MLKEEQRPVVFGRKNNKAQGFHVLKWVATVHKQGVVGGGKTPAQPGGGQSLPILEGKFETLGAWKCDFQNIEQ